MSNIIKQIEEEQMRKDMPDFAPGDTVIVQVKVKDGTRERLQAFEGVVIAIRNRGLNSAFTVRKISHGIGVERVFQTHSPMVASITIKRRGDVRRAKLYYLRDLSGKAARIKEDLHKSKQDKVAAKEAKKAADKAAAEAKEAEEKAAKEAEKKAKAEADAAAKAEAPAKTEEGKEGSE